MSIETANKIKTLLKSQNKKQKNLVDYLEESQGTVAKWLSENETINRDIPYTILVKIANFTTTTTDYLLGKENIVETKVIPLIGKSSCGKPKDYDLNGYDPVPIPMDLYRTGMYALEADGDSMSPKINDGDIVYCCPSQHIDNGKIVHYWLNGESGIKRYKINEAGTIISLVPINSEYDIITIHCDENVDLQMAKVVGKIDKDF